MLKYYSFVSSQKMSTLSAKLSWSYYDEILKFKDYGENLQEYILKFMDYKSTFTKILKKVYK